MKVLNTLTIVITTAIFSGAVISGQPIVRKSTSLVKKQPLELPEGKLDIFLTGIKNGTDYLIAIKTRSGVSPFAALGGAVLDSPSLVGARSLVSLETLPSVHRVIGRGSIELNLAAASHSGILAYIEVLPGTKISCVVNQKLLVATVVSSSLMIRSGEIINEDVTGYSRALTRLHHPPVPAPPDLTFSSPGLVISSSENLTRHLLEAPYPESAMFTDQCDCVRRATLIIVVNESGKVARIASTGGDQALVAVVRPYVLKWAFSPFTKDGKPLEVRAVVPFVASKEGKIRRLI